jgi:hypothetical protein
MSEVSDRTLALLQEVELLKEAEHPKTRANAARGRKRRKEISEELKQLASEKKRQTE